MLYFESIWQQMITNLQKAFVPGNYTHRFDVYFRINAIWIKYLLKGFLQ